MSRNITESEMSKNLSSNMSSIYASESGYQEVLDVAFVINKYYLWVIVAVGFPGNMATITTIVRMRSFGSFTFYVAVLATVDNLAIAVKTMLYQLYENQINITTAGCRTLFFLGNFLATFANWILVLMAVERLVAVRYPLKIKKYLGCRKSSMAIFSVGIIIGGLYAPILWISYFNEKKWLCVLDRDIKEMTVILYWVNVLLFAFIPFVILALCNLFIVCAIRKSFRIQSSMRDLHTMSIKRRSSCNYMSVQRQIMFMLFTSTLVFVVFLFPLCAFQVANGYWRVVPQTRGYAIKYLINQIAYVLCDSTHAVNFYLYFLSAKKFRCHFLRMTSCISHSPRPSPV